MLANWTVVSSLPDSLIDSQFPRASHFFCRKMIEQPWNDH